MSRYLKSAKKKKSFWKVSGSLEKKISMRLWKYLRLKLRKVKRDGRKMEKLCNLTGEDDDTMIG